MDTTDEKDYKKFQKAQVALPIWQAHQLRLSLEKNLRTGDPLQPDRTGGEKIVSAREFKVKGKMEERTGWQGQSESQIEEKWQTCWCFRDQQSLQNDAGLSRQHLPKGKEWSWCQRENSWQYAKAAFAKRKSSLSKALNCKVGGSQDEREQRLGEREEDQNGSMESKEWTPQQGWGSGARELGFFEGAGAGAIKIFGSFSSYPIIEKM